MGFQFVVMFLILSRMTSHK